MSTPLEPSGSPSQTQGTKGKGKAVEVLSDSESSSGEVESSLLSRPKFHKVAPNSQASRSTQPQASTSKSNIIVIDDSSDEESAVPKVELRSSLRDGTKEEPQEVDQLDDEDEASGASAVPSIGSISNDEEDRIMRSWRQEVPQPKQASRYSWTPLLDSPELSRLLRSHKAIFKLQRKAGRDETLILRARQRITRRLSTYARQQTGTSHLGSFLTRYEVFCRDHDIPLFPPSDAILALYYGSSAKKLKSSEATRRTKATQLRSLLYLAEDLYPLNKSLRKLQQYPGSAAAVEEYIKNGSNNRVEPVSQSASAQPSGSSLPGQPGPSAIGNPNAQARNIFPIAAVGSAGFTEAHCRHYLELQAAYHSVQITPDNLQSLIQYAGTLERYAVEHGARPSVPGQGLIEEGQGTRPQPKKEDEANLERSQSRNVSQPKRHATASPSPALDEHNPKRLRLSSIDERNPSPSSDPLDETESSSKPPPPPKVESPPPPPVVSRPIVSVFKLPNNQSRLENQASSIVETSKATNPDSKPSLASAQQLIIPSPGPSTSTASDVFAHPQPRPRPRPRPSRVSLLAQSALSSDSVDPPVPLSVNTLRSFLSSLSSSLDFLAEPLHSSGLDTFEVLSLFVAFEVDTRIRMVALACKRAGVEVKEEHLETLEGAIDNGRETDWA